MKANSTVLWNRVWHQVLGLAAALAIVLANVATAAGPAAAVGPTTTSAQGGGPQEGIKVHGHWTIVVRNSDGTVAIRREFENALATGAGPYLATVLARGATLGRWGVVISGLTSGLCIDPNGNPNACIIAEPGLFTGTFSNISPTLSISVPQAGPDAGMFVLSGSIRAARAGTIGAVDTEFGRCPATTAPASPCDSGTVSPLTTRVLGTASPIPVVAGQTIDVTVKISFS